LNSAIQDRLYSLEKKFNRSSTEIIFISLLLPLLLCSLFYALMSFLLLIWFKFPIQHYVLLGFIILVSLFKLLFYAFRNLVKHNQKNTRLQQQHNKPTKSPATEKRIFGIIVFSALSIVLFWLVHTNPYEWTTFDEITTHAKSIISLDTLIITSPIVFIVWVFRDKNKLLALENTRKDTNLKEFQQLQRWATGNIDGGIENQNNKAALQISALHSLRAYLKGEYGESFRRGAYEIFRAILATQHQKILRRVKDKEFEGIEAAINNCQLTKQLNIIASEEWFNLLINHNFPTKNISLIGVDLSNTYLHHRIYGKTLDLQFAQLQGANLADVQLQEANLMGANLQKVNLKGAQLQKVNLKGAQLQKANLERVQLQKAYLEGAQLQGANLRQAKLQEAYLADAQLQGADLWAAKLQGVSLQFVQLQGANLGGAQLQGVDFRGAQLQGVDLMNAQLQGSVFGGAQLQGICASGTFYLFNFEQRIKQQIGKNTAKKDLEERYEALNETQKAQLIAKLKEVGGKGVDNGIRRIKLASETLDLSRADTGTYNQEEADKWIKDYKDATNNVF